jgi:hypothetical protein
MVLIMKMQNLGIALGVAGLGVVLQVVNSPANALVFNATYTDTVSNVKGVNGISVGDSAVITVALDNGGTSIDGQTWTPSEIDSITFNFNNGANETVFNPVFTAKSGNFVTNGAGVLTSVTSKLNSNNVSVKSTNSTTVPSGFYLNGSNQVFYTTSNFTDYVSLTNVTNDTNAADWTISAASSPVPWDFDPTAGAAIGIPLFFGLRILRGRRSYIQRVIK